MENVISNIVCQHNNGAFQILRLQIYFGSEKKGFTQTSLRIFPVKSAMLTYLQYATQQEIKIYGYFTYFFPNTTEKINDVIVIIIYFQFKVQSQWTYDGFPSVKTATS